MRRLTCGYGSEKKKKCQPIETHYGMGTSRNAFRCGIYQSVCCKSRVSRPLDVVYLGLRASCFRPFLGQEILGITRATNRTYRHLAPAFLPYRRGKLEPFGIVSFHVPDHTQRGSCRTDQLHDHDAWIFHVLSKQIEGLVRVEGVPITSDPCAM